MTKNKTILVTLPDGWKDMDPYAFLNALDIRFIEANCKYYRINMIDFTGLGNPTLHMEEDSSIDYASWKGKNIAGEVFPDEMKYGYGPKSKEDIDNMRLLRWMETHRLSPAMADEFYKEYIRLMNSSETKYGLKSNAQYTVHEMEQIIDVNRWVGSGPTRVSYLKKVAKGMDPKELNLWIFFWNSHKSKENWENIPTAAKTPEFIKAVTIPEPRSNTYCAGSSLLSWMTEAERQVAIPLIEANPEFISCKSHIMTYKIKIKGQLLKPKELETMFKLYGGFDKWKRNFLINKPKGETNGN